MLNNDCLVRVIEIKPSVRQYNTSSYLRKQFSIKLGYLAWKLFSGKIHFSANRWDTPNFNYASKVNYSLICDLTVSGVWSENVLSLITVEWADYCNYYHLKNIERIGNNGACPMYCKPKERGLAYNRSNLYGENFYKFIFKYHLRDLTLGMGSYSFVWM